MAFASSWEQRGPRLDVPFAFNISHDGPFVLLGITHAPGAELGVDIMRVPNRQDAVDIEEAVSDQVSTPLGSH
jgi:phosphopantetheinyl transferase